MREEILVLDFGSQYNQLLARRIRDLGTYSELVPYDISIEEIKKRNVIGIVFSGGPNSVYEEASPKCRDEIFDLGLPILGVCYGHQLITQHFGGNVSPCEEKEYGAQLLFKQTNSVLLSDIPDEHLVWMSHGDQAIILPDGFEVVASTQTCKIAAMQNVEKKIYGLQFHPEVRNSEYGLKIIENFVKKVCSSSSEWSMKTFVEDKVKEIKNEVKDKRVLLGISGGVDSTVAATLIHKAIGNQLTCMFIDHGLLREDEADLVMERFARHDINVVKIDASDIFLGRLKGVVEPEQKRKIIGNTFVEVFDKESAKIGDYSYLGQGTLYTDIIESGTKTAQKIKSHHNVGGLPKEMKFKLLEPLKELFKDEVRKVGIELGLDEELVMRQPFPGPGLSIRIIGEITEEKLRMARHSDLILREEFHKAGLDKTVWQYFTVITANKSVGVMGDQRTYEYTCAVRAVTSIDGMSADFARVPYEVLAVIASRIINEVSGLNRVVYDITSKPPGTIEWE